MRENYPYASVRGMHDLFPEEVLRYQRVERLAQELLTGSGYGEIRTPMVEPAALFERSIGQGTDIVNKEMFFVTTRDHFVATRKEPMNLVLRPEATAAVVRAYVEHEIHKQEGGMKRYYYIGPMFRHERPQKGRLRQFTQIGIEILGCALPLVDAEAIILLYDFLTLAGLSNLTLQINSVGCKNCRPAFIQQLQTYARRFHNQWCADCQSRLEKNPLRLLDCKSTACRNLLAQAPDIQTYLCPACQNHQQVLQQLLQSAGITYQLNSRLVRGLDYYTRTVFEVTSQTLGAQNAVAAGGRYDDLVAELKGPNTPAVGWSLGIERLLELLPESSEKLLPDVFVIAPSSEAEQTFIKVLQLRRQGIKIRWDYSDRSVKALLKQANREGARFCLFILPGEKERVELKNMASGEQFPLDWQAIRQHVQSTLPLSSEAGKK